MASGSADRPLILGWAATLTSIGLAVAPGLGGGPYDPTVAVLTATLIAIIWYTYFSYRLLRRQEPAYLKTSLHFDWDELVFTPQVRNPTTSRVLRVRTFCNVTIDDQPVDLGPFYRGEPSEEVVLGPGDAFTGVINIPNRVWTHTDGEGIKHYDKNKVLIELSARWTDEHRDQGATPVRRWEVDLVQEVFTALLGQSELDRHRRKPIAGTEVQLQRQDKATAPRNGG